MRFRSRIIHRLRVPLLALAAAATIAPASVSAATPCVPPPPSRIAASAKGEYTRLRAACASVASTTQPVKVVGDTPADYPGASRAPAEAVPGDTPTDYPGMPGAPAPGELADAATTHAPEERGFDWPSAGIGAAGAGLLIVVSLAGVSVLSRRRTRVAR